MEGNNGRISVKPRRSNSRMTKTLFITFDEKWLASSLGLFTFNISPVNMLQSLSGSIQKHTHTFYYIYFYTKNSIFVEEVSFIAVSPVLDVVKR